MGLRKDLDVVKKRYIYLLLDEDFVIYVGTACNYKSRYRSHLKRSKTENALIYRYIRSKKITPTMKVVKEIVSTYKKAEEEEIRLIVKHSDTCLNFYNNPNKKRYNELKEKYKN